MNDLPNITPITDRAWKQSADLDLDRLVAHGMNREIAATIRNQTPVRLPRLRLVVDNTKNGGR